MFKIDTTKGSVNNNFKVGEKVYDHKGNNAPFIFTAEHIKHAENYDCNRYGRAGEAFKELTPSKVEKPKEVKKGAK